MVQQSYKDDEDNEDNRYSVVPYRKSDLDDSFLDMLEKEIAKNQDYYDDDGDTPPVVQGDDEDTPPSQPTLDYMEGGTLLDSMPDASASGLQDVVVRDAAKGRTDEVLPSDVVYSKPHRVQKASRTHKAQY